MIATNLEDVIPGLREMRATERRNRALAFAGLTHTICGVETVSLTPDHRLKLQLLRNAFTIPGVRPLIGDVFVFLWVILAPGSGLFRQWRLRRHVRRLAVAMATMEINAQLSAQLQDLPELATAAGNGSTVSDSIHWMAAEASFWIDVHGGFTLESYRRTPYLVLQQLHRAWRCNHPNMVYNKDGTVTAEQPDFINGSDALIVQWQRARAGEIATMIQARRERLP